MKSYLVSLSYSFVSGAVWGGLLLAFGRQFLSFFANEPEGITAGMERIKIMGCSYTISAFMDCTIAASRGIGKSVAPTITVILGSYVFRTVWVYTVFAHFKRSARSICCTAFHGRLPRRLRSSIPQKLPRAVSRACDEGINQGQRLVQVAHMPISIWAKVASSMSQPFFSQSVMAEEVIYRA